MQLRSGLLTAILAAFIAAGPAEAADPVPAASGPLCVSASEAAGPLPAFARLQQLHRDQLATFALPFALMARNVRSPTDNDVRGYGYERGPDSNALFAAYDPGARVEAAVVGFFAGTFIHCASGTVVIVVRSTSPYDPRDLVTGLFRHAGHGYSSLVLRFFDAVAERFPGHPIMVVGHSSGGGLASYLAGRRGVPSVVFNGTRSGAALTNPGTLQLTVVVNGDVIGDAIAASARHNGRPEEPLRGVVLRLDPIADYSSWRRHWISTVIDALDRMLGLP